MARTKKNRQTLGGQLQSARAKHDTALEAEILGKLADKANKPPKVKKPKTTDGKEGQTTEGGKTSSQKKAPKEKKEKRNGLKKKKELKATLASSLSIAPHNAGELIKRANSQFTFSEMLRAASSLDESGGGDFTEAEFMAKAAEIREVGAQGEGAVQSKAERKAERKAQAKAKQGKNMTGVEKKKGESSSRVPEPQQSHIPEAQQSQQSSEVTPDKIALPGNNGFSKDFWMDLAGSREAAAVAAL